MTELIHQTDHGKLISAAPVMSNDPAAYRLARRNGELILQGAYRWQQGSMGGCGLASRRTLLAAQVFERESSLATVHLRVHTRAAVHGNDTNQVGREQ